MNCKPGLAIVIGGNFRFRGLIVEVVKLAPAARFQLPDGRQHVACPLGSWVIKLPRVFLCPTQSGDGINSEWAVISDSKLRPVSGLPVDEETTTDLETPCEA